MKIFKYISILFVLVLSANQLTVLSYWATQDSEAFPSSSSVQLLLDYVDDYKRQINSLFAKYEIENSEVVSSFNRNISEIKKDVSKVINGWTPSNQYQDIITAAISDLKILNNKMKIYLDQEILLYKQKIMREQETYDTIGKKISPILRNIIQRITDKLSRKSILNESEKEIVRSLIRLRDQDEKISKFWNINFWSRDQMKEYFKSIIISIRTEIILIKKLSS